MNKLDQLKQLDNNQSQNQDLLLKTNNNLLNQLSKSTTELTTTATNQQQVHTYLTQQKKSLEDLKNELDTKNRMLQLSIDRNVYKKKQMYMNITIILLLLVLMGGGYFYL